MSPILKTIDILGISKFLHLYQFNFKVGNKEKKQYVASRNKPADLAIYGNKKNEDAVAIIAIHNNKLVAINEFRYAIGNYIWDLPAGCIEPRETAISCAIKELYEETGLVMTEKDVFSVQPGAYSSPGMSDESVAVVWTNATGTLSNNNVDGDEIIRPRLLSLQDIETLLSSGELLGSRFSLIAQASITGIQNPVKT